jgi:hypothetical protein
MQSSRDYRTLSLLENLGSPRSDPLYYGNWWNVGPETRSLGFYAEHESLIYIRLAPHHEHVLFLKWTHTAICLCALAKVRTHPGVQLQLQIAPPYSLLPARMPEPECEIWVCRRDRWEMHEPPPTEPGWARPTVILTLEDRSYTVNHCQEACPTFFS